MAVNDEDVQRLEKLEASLWKRETRFDEEYMRNIMTEDFFEFGRSGRIYSIEDSLSVSDRNIKARLPLKNFKVHKISDTVALVTYISQIEYNELELSNRSSLWFKTETGWKLRFHQGTPVQS